MKSVIVRTGVWGVLAVLVCISLVGWGFVAVRAVEALEVSPVVVVGNNQFQHEVVCKLNGSFVLVKITTPTKLKFRGMTGNINQVSYVRMTTKDNSKLQ